MPSSMIHTLLMVMLGAAAGLASAGPVAGGTLGLLADGTSNTVRLTEQTRVTACIDLPGGSSLPTIVDGTSNTLLFGESRSLTLRVGHRYPWQPIGNLLDGSSNTILIGESAPDRVCLGGDTRLVDVGGTIDDGSSNTIGFPEGSRLDLCLRNVSVGQVVDGSSNTILFGEVSTTATCFSDVRVTVTEPGPAAVPLPGTLALLGLGVAGVLAARRRRIGTAPGRDGLERSD